MITKKLRKSLSKTLNHAKFSQLFTWGPRTINLGHENEGQGPSLLSSAPEVQRVAMGQHHTALLDTSGQLYTFGDGSEGALGNGGSDLVETPQKISTFEKHGLTVVDFDCGQNHTVAATSDGAVYTWGFANKNPPVMSDMVHGISPLGHGNSGIIPSPTQVESLRGTQFSQVAAGNLFTAAVTAEGDQLYMWGYGPHGVFTGHTNRAYDYPTLIEEVSELLQERGETIADIRAAGDSTMILTSGGALFGWGGNSEAQLGNNHDKLNIGYKNVYHPTPVYPSYEGTVLGFDLSEDVLIFYTDANLAYYAGRYEQFTPREISLPLGGQIESVGATTSGFAITTEGGQVYTYGHTLKTDKFFFDQQLSLSDQSDFEGMNVCAVGGAFQNVFALAK